MEQADPMINEMSQMELFFRFGKDIRIEEKDSKFIITAKFPFNPNGMWVGSYGSNE
jgi:hypothetical protein